MLPGIITALICFGLFIAAVFIRFNRPPVGQRMQVMTRLWLAMLPVYIVCYFALRKSLPASFSCPLPWEHLEGLAGFGNGVLLYLLMFFGWCYCYFCADHSLSVAYMLALERMPQRRLNLEDLKTMFPYPELVSQRLRDLEANGFLTRDHDAYQLTAKGQRQAKFAGTLKRLLQLEPGG